jgi:hypothetical protein
LQARCQEGLKGEDGEQEDRAMVGRSKARPSCRFILPGSLHRASYRGCNSSEYARTTHPRHAGGLPTLRGPGRPIP